MKKSLLLSVAALMPMLILFAQAPSLLNYQGVARNSVGNALASKAIAIRLSIHNNTANGPVVYAETRSVTTNTFGLFTVLVGSPGATAQTGTLATVNWATGTKFIQSEIDPAGGNAFVDIGTAQLASVPYALNAASAVPSGNAGGSLTGVYPNPTIANAAITQAMLAPGLTIPITGAAGGDLSGNYPNPVVTRLQGRAIASTAPTSGQFMRWNAATNVWEPATIGAGGFTLPFVANVNSANTQFSINNAGDGVSVEGTSGSTTANIVALRGTVTSTTPGGFSSGVRGINNGTGGLGIGVWGSHNGSGWGVYGVSPAGIGVYGNSSAAGTGVFGNSNTGTGILGTSTNGTAASFTISNNANSNNVISANTLGNGNVINASTSGNGYGITASSTGNSGVRGATASQTAAGVIGYNTGGGEVVVGIGNSDIGGAVVGRNDGGGYGVRGFIASNTSGTGIGVFGQVGIAGSTGRAARFENLNATNSAANTLEVETNGNGNIPDITKGNASSFLVTNTNSIGAAVRAEVKTMFANFGAAAIFGISSGTGGYAGLFHSSNTAGTGAAVVAVTDGFGNAVTANAGKNGNGVESSIDGTGSAVYGWVPSFASGRAGRFANYSASNTNAVVDIANAGVGTALLINHTGTSGNLAVLRANGVNVARIDRTGRAFFNGGTQNSGADIAEYFDVEGDKETYQPGDVLVISTSSDRKVEKSSTPYSTLVSGVYATKPGVLLTEKEVGSNDLDEMVPMGVIGVIPTKVCLEGGIIHRGDLVVTSSLPGTAMKADPDKVKIGQVIGKALQDYTGNNTGMIKVLVSIK